LKPTIPQFAITQQIYVHPQCALLPNSYHQGTVGWLRFNGAFNTKSVISRL